MFILRGFVAVSLSLAFAASILAAPNRPLAARGKGGSSGIEGTVVQVHHHSANRNTGWIKLRRPAAGGRGQLMTFAVNPSTRFQRLGQRGNSRTTFSALRRGERVRVLGSGPNGAARIVNILSNSFHRSRNRFVSGSYRRSYLGRRHVYRRSLPARSLAIRRRVVVPLTPHPVAAQAAKRNVKRTVKHEVKNHKPAPPKHTPIHTNHTHSAGHSHSSSHSHSTSHHKK